MQQLSAAQPERRPTFYDLMSHADAGPFKRAVTRYLVPRDPEASVRRHQRLGSPIIRKVVMGTIGRFTKPFNPSNYRMDIHSGRMEGAANFAFRQSAFNEVVHLGGVGLGLESIIHHVVEGSVEASGVAIGAFAANSLLVALQRYNRARMVRFVDRQLQRGEEFRPGYRNWLHVDASAYENFAMAESGLTAQADRTNGKSGEMSEAVDTGATDEDLDDRPDEYPAL